MGNAQSLRELLKIYKPKGIDWMEFKLNKNNPYTFHHIIKKEYDGDNSVDNGAILTAKAHNLLHVVEFKDIGLYDEWNDLFAYINSRRAPINEDCKKLIHKLNVYTTKKHKRW